MSEQNTKLGPICRHFLAREAIMSNGACCKIGHPIRKIVIAANGGATLGIAYMFPCRPGPERKANCPSYDPKTDAEVAAEKAAHNLAVDRFVDAMPRLSAIRAGMVKDQINRQITDCPFCDAPNTLHVSCAIGFNNHMRAQCAQCGQGFIE